jgi:hypothetical protein
MRKIVYNALQTPDGTIIESTGRHDYVEYRDKNGKTYIIDGGLSYIRSTNHGDERYLTKYADQPHELIRNYAFRTGYGKPGTPEYGTYRLTRIKDMDEDHLDGAIEYVKQRIAHDYPTSMINELEDDEHPFELQVLLNEKEYRNKK